MGWRSDQHGEGSSERRNLSHADHCTFLFLTDGIEDIMNVLILVFYSARGRQYNGA